MDACCLYDHTFVYLPNPQDGEVVKNSASPKRPFVLDFMSFSPFFPFSVQILGKHTFYTFFCHKFSISFLFLKTTPTSSPKGGGGTLYMHVHFPIGTRPHLAQKGGHVPEMPPPPLDPLMLVPCFQT